jgi:uncharacterized protein YciI
MPYFVVINEQGPSWAASVPMRDQQKWNEHADYVNAAMYAGTVILGGRLGDGSTHRALLIANSESESALQTWLREDPWILAGILRTASVEAWELLVSNDKLDPVLAEITRSSPPVEQS